MEREEKRILKNGIPVYSYRNPSLHSFYISLFLRTGSMYESEEESGMTHFLEHLLIRNINSVRNGEMYSMLDRYGIEFNASTYSEMVQFYTTGASQNFEKAVGLISELFSPISLSAEEIATERERIKAEIRESDDKTSLSSFSSEIVHAGTSLSRPILGTLGSVSKITKKRLEAFRARAFSNGNLFVYLTGNYSDDDLELLARTLGEKTLGNAGANENLAPVSQSFGKRKPAAYIKNADFTMVRFSFDIDMSRIAFGADDLLYDILLGGYNSHFFIEMSEKRGLFYDLSGSVEKYKNIGCFVFSFEVRGSSVYEAVEMTLSILSQMKEKLLPEEKCMKAGYVDNGALLYDDARDLNFTFSYDCHIMDAPYRSIEERSAYYNSITPKIIRDAAREIFRPENLTLTLKGNKKKIDPLRLASLIEEKL